ncbi:MAG: polyphosphate kinase 1 [Ruminococcaceae bacterium]|nr:polyphosphate kinase 1 [Oscillospiraceae bacterium]
MYNSFINRELSWLKFNQRVLKESLCPTNPTFEKIKFVSIFNSNLDEFFMIRVGSLHDRSLLSEIPVDNKTGLNALEQLEDIFSAVKPLYEEYDNCFEKVSEELKQNGIEYCDIPSLSKNEKEEIKKVFKKDIFPLLSPQIIDPTHPFPHLENKKIYIVADLLSGDKKSVGIIPLSNVIPRLFFLDTSKDRIKYVLAENILEYFIKQIFKVYKVTSSAIIRVTRNADIAVADTFSDDDIDYRAYMKEILKKREKLAPVRLEIVKGGEKLEEYLRSKLSLSPAQCYTARAPLDMSYIWSLEDKLTESMKISLLHKPLSPQWPQEIRQKMSVINQVDERDFLLRYPYDSMKPYLNMLSEAAFDPQVVSIKITLYRLSSSSQVIQHLCDAAENGKEVTVLVELKARFDEANNIHWSKRLSDAGCRVIYGIEGYKVHSKITLVTRQTDDGIKYTVHIGTGNYNEKTARLYTDVGILTSREEIAEDAVRFFHDLTISNLNGRYKKLLVAPHSFKTKIISLIRAEADKARRGRKGIIKLKLNSITDKEIMLELIAAAQAGVKIKMLVRGICCLCPGIENVTENIDIISIVGRYLEHSRIYVFGEKRSRKLYISSADFMTRNTSRRVEIAAPILDSDIADRLEEMLELQFSDNVKAHRLLSDKSYEKICAPQDGEEINSQMEFYNH